MNTFINLLERSITHRPINSRKHSHFWIRFFEVFLQQFNAEVGVRNMFAVEFDVGDLTLLAHLCVVDVLVWDPGQAKPSLKLDAEGGNTANLK